MSRKSVFILVKIMSKKKKIIIIIILSLLIAAATITIILLSNRTEKYYIPIEVLIGEDAKDADEEYLEEYEKYVLKSKVATGVWENAYINSDREIVLEYTKEQKEAEIEGLVDILSFDVLGLSYMMGISGCKYNDDYTEVTAVIVSEKNTDSFVGVYISAMLMYQILNDVPVDKASVEAEITYVDTQETKNITYNCYNLY